MSDGAPAWTQLVPLKAGLELRGLPGDIQSLLEPLGRPSADTLVSWDASPTSLVSLERYAAVVLMRPRAGSADVLRAGGFSRIRQFAVLPDVRRARWYVPVGSRKMAARAWDLYAPETRLGRLVRLGARLITRTLGPSLLGEPLIMAERTVSGLEAAVAQATGREDFDLAIGAPHKHGQRGRLWLLIIDQAGASLAYAKLAYLEQSTRQLVREAAFTQRAVGLSLRTLAVPSVLHAGRLGDGYLMISQSLANASRVRPVLGSKQMLALSELAAHRGICSTGELLGRLQERCRRLEPDLSADWAARLGRAVGAVASTEGLPGLPTTLAHGDFVPWNMRDLDRDGRLALFDWEQGQQSQFLLWDTFNFLTQVDIVLRRTAPEHSVHATLDRVAASPLARQSELRPTHLRALYLAYLADASVQWFEAHPPSTWAFEIPRTRSQPMRAGMLDAALALTSVTR
jgi:Phosphotransferase enzyme family